MSAFSAIAAVADDDNDDDNEKFTKDFMLDECDGFSSNGSNPFFFLEPGNRLVLADTEDGVEKRVKIDVLSQTKTVDGVETRVIREKETEDGEPVEISHNYYAICNRDNSVVYFGEDVDIYEDGEVVSHDGSFLAGEDGARAGIIMPGTVLLGARYFQELAPGVALDRAEIDSLSVDVSTPAGNFEDCLRTKETTTLEPGSVSTKKYCPGVGLVQDGDLRLVSRRG